MDNGYTPGRIPEVDRQGQTVAHPQLEKIRIREHHGVILRGMDSPARGFTSPPKTAKSTMGKKGEKRHPEKSRLRPELRSTNSNLPGIGEGKNSYICSINLYLRIPYGRTLARNSIHSSFSAISLIMLAYTNRFLSTPSSSATSRQNTTKIRRSISCIRSATCDAAFI